MATLFEYFLEQQKRRKPFPQEANIDLGMGRTSKHPERQMPLMGGDPPEQVAEETFDISNRDGIEKYPPTNVSVDGLGSTGQRERVVPTRQPANATRPRMADVPVEMTPQLMVEGEVRDLNLPHPDISGISEPAPLKSDLEIARMELANLKNNPAVNNDKGWKGRLGDIIREAIIGGGQAYRQNPRGGIGSIIGGALGGAGTGAYDPSRDEERQRQADIQHLQGNIGEMERQEAMAKQLRDEEYQRRVKGQELKLRERALDINANNTISREKIAVLNSKDKKWATEFNALSKAIGKEGVTIDTQTLARAKKLGVPITKQDAKKNIKLIHDQNSDQHYVVLTDTRTGNTETRMINGPDGKTPLQTKSTAKLNQEGADTRQEKGFNVKKEILRINQAFQKATREYNEARRLAKEDRDEGRRIAAETRAQQAAERVLLLKKELDDLKEE